MLRLVCHCHPCIACKPKESSEMLILPTDIVLYCLAILGWMYQGIHCCAGSEAAAPIGRSMFRNMEALLGYKSCVQDHGFTRFTNDITAVVAANAREHPCSDTVLALSLRQAESDSWRPPA
eukprot:scaffold233601_cov20-Prasinocladus_malaysianus.AAC.1